MINGFAIDNNLLTIKGKMCKQVFRFVLVNIQN